MVVRKSRARRLRRGRGRSILVAGEGASQSLALTIGEITIRLYQVKAGLSGCDNLENGGQADSRRQWLRPLTTDGQPCGEHLTHQPLLEPLRRPTPRPIIHSHLTKQAAVTVARATAGKVLASRCGRQGQSTRGGMITPPVKCIISTTWYLYRAAGSSSSSSCVRGYQPRPSRPGSP